MLENPEWMPPPPGEREAANEANAAAEEAEEARLLIEAEEQRVEEERARAEEERSEMEAQVMRQADEEFERRMAEEEARKEEAAREAAVALAALGPDEQRAHLLSKMAPHERELFEGAGLAAMLDQVSGWGVYCDNFLLLPIAPSVSCSCLDALYTRSSKLLPSPAVSYCLPMSTTRLSLLPNLHP